MDDMEDECTAVIKINKNFEEKFGTFKRPRLDSDINNKSYKSSTELNWLKQRLSGVQNESEVIALKANVSELNHSIETLEKKLSEERIRNNEKLNYLHIEHKKTNLQMVEAREHAVEMTSNYETAKEEIENLKKLLQSSNDQLKEKDKAATLITVQSELDEVKHITSEKARNYEIEVERLKNALINLTEENDLLCVQVKNKSSETRKLEFALEDVKYQLSVLNQRNKDYELERSRSEENLKQTRWIQSKLERCDELEEENKRFKQDILYFKSQQGNTVLLQEKCKSMQDKLQRSEKRCSEYTDLQLENETLTKKVADFNPLFHSIPTLKCASDVVQLIEDLNRTNQLYVEANGTLKTRLHKYEDELSSSHSELKKLRTELSEELIECESVTLQCKKFKQKLVLVVKERDSYKGILDSLNEMTSTDSWSKNKIKLLEETCEGSRKLCTEQESEVQKLSDLIQKLKKKITILEQQLVEERMKVSKNVSLNYDGDIILSQREQIAELQRKLEEMINEKEMLELRVEKNDLMGHYNPMKTKVIKMQCNPYTLARENIVKELESLKEEHQILKLRMKTMVESGGSAQDELTTRTNQALATIGTVKEKEELRSQFESSELLNKRLKETYEKVSQSFKSMVSKLLGYKVERTEEGIYRLASIFADSPTDFFIFEESNNNVFTLMENDYLFSFRDLVEKHLKGSDALPAFMSSITLLLRERQGFDSMYE